MSSMYATRCAGSMILAAWNAEKYQHFFQRNIKQRHRMHLNKKNLTRVYTGLRQNLCKFSLHGIPQVGLRSINPIFNHFYKRNKI